VDDAARLLLRVADELSAAAERDPEKPELWLNVRELTGLGHRLCATDEWQWHHGFGASWIVGQDFGVMDELMSDDAPYMSMLTPLTTGQLAILARARSFLRRYRDHEFVGEDPRSGAA
jgi:hypothetical protein